MERDSAEIVPSCSMGKYRNGWRRVESEVTRYGIVQPLMEISHWVLGGCTLDIN